MSQNVGRTILICLLGTLLLLAACQSATTSASTTGTSDAKVVDGTATPEPNETPEPDEEVTEEADGEEETISEITPLPPDETAGPVQIQIPEIELDAPVIAMGWKVETVGDKRTTVWDLPLDKAGWHINSVGAGGAGNTIISGRQVGGDAVFAPLALGSVAPGQEVLLTDGDGFTFVYRITEVTDPIPVTGATPEELELAATYFEPTTDARLTLVTGWPDFTTTHRIFAVAEFVGELK